MAVRITATDPLLVEAHVRPGRICTPDLPRFKIFILKRRAVRGYPTCRCLSLETVQNPNQQPVVQPRLLLAFVLSALEKFPRHACSLGRYSSVPHSSDKLRSEV
jgi:hypothetical protein